MKTYDEIFQRVQEIIRNCTENELPEITINNRFDVELGFDSVEMVNLQISLEDEFDFVFDPIEDDFEQIFYSVKSVCDYLKDVID